MSNITKDQIKAYKTLINKLKIDKETELSMLERYKVNSCKFLSRSDAIWLIKELSKRVNEPKKNIGKGQRGSQMHLTDLQAERIILLQQLLGYHDAGLQSFIHRQVGKLKSVSMLMNYEASKVIVGMEKVFAGKNRELFLRLNKMSNAELKSFIKNIKGVSNADA
mgnify:CR=1 FL=1